MPLPSSCTLHPFRHSLSSPKHMSHTVRHRHVKIQRKDHEKATHTHTHTHCMTSQSCQHVNTDTFKSKPSVEGCVGSVPPTWTSSSSNASHQSVASTLKTNDDLVQKRSSPDPHWLARVAVDASHLFHCLVLQGGTGKTRGRMSEMPLMLWGNTRQPHFLWAEPAVYFSSRANWEPTVGKLGTL